MIPGGRTPETGDWAMVLLASRVEGTFVNEPMSRPLVLRQAGGALLSRMARRRRVIGADDVTENG
jgi:hypothetical protein